MKILLISTGSDSRGGGEIFLDYLGKGLADCGHEVLLWVPSHSRMHELAERVARFGQVIRAHYRNTYDHWGRCLNTCLNRRTSRRLAQDWEALRPDVIHVNKQNLEDGLDLLRAARQCSVPSVCTIHLTQSAHYLGAMFGGLRDWIARNSLSKYTGVFVTVQDSRRKALDEFVGRSVRTRTIFNGVPLIDRASAEPVREVKRRELGVKKGEFLILGIGRLAAQKRPLLFLKTAQELHRHLPSARFVWVGDGKLASEWNAWVAREQLERVISCVGWQSDTLPFLLAGDLLLHVAEFEGLPFAVLEAMAAGLPCAVTRSFAAEIPLFDASNVLFMDDPQVLSSQLRDEVALGKIVAGALRLMREKLSIPTMVASYERLYAEVIGR